MAFIFLKKNYNEMRLNINKEKIMFSWIIHKKAKIISVENWNFCVEKTFPGEIMIGESIAHDWACMTITEWDEEKYHFFVMEESLKKTALWEKKAGDYINVERSLTLADAMHGHMVSWHIDSTWIVDNVVTNKDESIEIFIQFDEKFSNFIIEKWSVAINWVSLTVCAVGKDYLSVNIIPHTQEITNLWLLKSWSKVNLEFDQLAKYIQKMIQK